MKRRSTSVATSLPSARRVLAHFAPHLARHRALAAFSLAMLLAEVALRVLEPWPLKYVIDSLTGRPATTDLPGTMFDSAGSSTLLALAAAAFVAMAGLRAAAAYWTAVGCALIGNRVLCDVRDALYLHVQRLSLSFHARAGSGDLVLRLFGDVGLLKDVVVTALLPLVGNVLVLVGMVSVMLWLQWQLALVALAFAPLLGLSTVRLGRRLGDIARDHRRREGTMASSAAESIGAIKTVQMFSLEPVFGELFARQSGRTLVDGVKAKRLEARLERTVDLGIAAATAVVLGYGGWLAHQGVLTAGDLVIFLTYFKTAFRPLRDFAKYTGRLVRAIAAGERVLDLLEQRPDVEDRPDARPAPRLSGAIRFDNVSVEYEPGRPVLHDVSFDVEPGQRIAIVGPSGSGKSTLLGLIPRLYDPSEGRIVVDGCDVRAYTLESLRAQLAIVPQEALLFRISVRDNIACAKRGAREDEIHRGAALANAHDFILDLPNGYDTVVGERGATLSAGQRQRIAIARAAIRDPAILILDEPTTGLDTYTEQAVLEALQGVSQGRTTFLVTHDLHLAATCDLIVYLEAGRVVERGTHRQLMAVAGRYASSVASEATARARHSEGLSHALFT